MLIAHETASAHWRSRRCFHRAARAEQASCLPHRELRVRRRLFEYDSVQAYHRRIRVMLTYLEAPRVHCAALREEHPDTLVVEVQAVATWSAAKAVARPEDYSCTRQFVWRRRQRDVARARLDITKAVHLCQAKGRPEKACDVRRGRDTMLVAHEAASCPGMSDVADTSTALPVQSQHPVIRIEKCAFAEDSWNMARAVSARRATGRPSTRISSSPLALGHDHRLTCAIHSGQ